MSRAPVVLENYNPQWPEQFEAEKARLLNVVGQWQVGAIEHIGSTAVPGMLAKPVIDILAPLNKSKFPQRNLSAI